MRAQDGPSSSGVEAETPARGEQSSGEPEQDRSSRLFIATSFISRLGDHLGEFGLTLILLDQYRGELWPALTFNIARSLTTLVWGRQLGALFDRYPTRTVLNAAILVQVLSLGYFAFLSQLGAVPVWYFLPASMGLGVGGFLYEVGLTYSLLPTIASGPKLQRYTAIFHSLHQFAEVGGPLLAGLLYVWNGAVPVLVADALTFGVEYLGLSLLKLPAWKLPALPSVLPSVLPSGERLARPSLWRTLGQLHRALVPLVLGVGLLWCNGMTPYSTAFMFFMREQVGLNEQGLSWVRTAGALSSVVGAALTPWLARRFSAGKLLLGGLGLQALTLLVAALFRHDKVWVLSSVVLSRLGLSVAMLTSMTLRQQLIPVTVRGEVNGRINAFYRGAGLVGVVFQLGLDQTSTSYAWLAWGTVLVIFTGAGLQYFTWRWLDQSAPQPET